MTSMLQSLRRSEPGKAAARRRRRPYALLAALVTVLAILFAPMLRPVPTYGSMRSDVGYPWMIKRLIDAGLLRLEDRGDGSGPGRAVLDQNRLAELVDQSKDGRGPLGQCQRDTSLTARLWQRVTHGAQTDLERCQALIHAYQRASYLREDMRVDSDAIWARQQNQLTGLAPGAHVVSDATAGITQWAGSVDYAAPYQTLMLIDTASRKVLFRFDPRQGGPVPLAPGQSVAAGAAELTGGIALLRAGDRQCSGSATLSLVGDHALLTLLPINTGSDCPDIWFDGELVHSRNFPVSGFRYRVLRPGQTLTVGEGQPVVMQLVKSIGAISALDEGRRRNETTLAAVGSAIAGGAPARSRVISSIDPLLHFTAQRRLEELGVRELVGERSSFRAGAMLVDGLSGEVVAAPTFPVAAGQLFEGDRKDPARLSWLGLNTNLQHSLAVGSAAKVPFAAAIVQEYPQLLTLKARSPGAYFDRLLGEPLGPKGIGTEDHFGAGEMIDFPTFIARSSNYYAMLLMKLAASPDPLASNGKALAPGEAYSIEGKARSRAPRMPERDQVWGLGWAEQLWRIDCLAPYPLARGGVLSGWEDRRSRTGCPLAYYGAADLAQPTRLYPIRHASPALQFSKIGPGNSYQDYLMSMVGQNRSLWTNAALVQAYARILANRQVALRFDKPGAAELRQSQGFAPLGLNPAVWSAVERGMGGAVQFGTAKKLKGALAGFEGIAIYAKTGTPTLARASARGSDAQQGHVFVVAFVRYRDGRRDPAGICSLRMAVANIEDRDGEGATPALDYIMGLMQDPAIAAWLRGSCNAPRRAGG